MRGLSSLADVVPDHHSDEGAEPKGKLLIYKTTVHLLRNEILDTSGQFQLGQLMF